MDYVRKHETIWDETNLEDELYIEILLVHKPASNYNGKT